MAQVIALLTSNAALLSCQLRRIDPAIDLGAGAGRTVGLGFHDSQGRVLLRKRPVSTSSVTLAELAGDVRSEVLLAACHVVGPTGFREEDSAPYRFRSWLFAGTGRIVPIGERAAVLQALPDFLRRGISGTSDAELAFVTTLGHIHTSSRQLDRFDLDPEVAAASLARTLHQLDERAAAARVAPPATAALLTNGRMIAAVRRGRPLSYALLEGQAECEACGITRTTSADDPRVRPHRTVRTVVVASVTQPGRGLQWLDVPESHLLTVSRSLDVRVAPLA